MNIPAGQLQARNVQSSVEPQGQVSASEAASILARERFRKQNEAQQAVEPQQVEELPPEGTPVDDGEVVDPGTDTEAPEGETAVEEQDPEGELYYELDGEEIPVAEVRKWREGAMRTEDYQRKTQAVAQREQAVTALGTDLDRYAHGLRRLFEGQIGGLVQVVRQFENEDWAGLANDPNKFNQRKAQFEVAKGRLQSAQQQFRNFLGEFDELGKRTVQMRAQAAIPVLKERIKGWNDSLYAELADYAVGEIGADRDVIAKVTDPWFWELAYKANLYDKAKKTLRKAPNKVRRGPSVSLQPGSPVRTGQNPQAEALRGAQQSATKAVGVRAQTEAALAVIRARRAAAQQAPQGRRR